MRHRLSALVLVLFATTACGGGSDDVTEAVGEPAVEDPGGVDDLTDEPATADESTADDDSAGDDDAAADEPAADPTGLPDECVDAPFDIDFTMSGVPEYATAPFTVEGAGGWATGIVPNGDGSLDDLDIPAFRELGDNTDLVLYTQWIGDHPFGIDDIDLAGPPDTPPGKITLGLTVVPPNEPGLAQGDIVTYTDEFGYDAITTFAPVGVYYQPPEGTETIFAVDNTDSAQGGSAEILYLDDEQICIRWQFAGLTRNPDGVYSLEGVVLTTFGRDGSPYT